MSKETTPDRATLDAQDIDRLMRCFYAKIRNHPELGPLFKRAVGETANEWRAHEAKIASFWRNALGIDRSYSGNPMMAHLENGDVQPAHFPIWLDLFRQSAHEVLPGLAAEGIAHLADRIGRGLSLGLETARGTPGAPPVFT